MNWLTDQNSLFLAKTIIEKLILFGSLSIYFLISSLPFVSNWSGRHGPWLMGHFFIPSSSHKLPSNSIKAMKWESQSALTADCPFWDAPLCYFLISEDFSKTFPRSSAGVFLTSSKNFFRYEPYSTMSGYSLRALRMTWKRAMVPHAFWAYCFM